MRAGQIGTNQAAHGGQVARFEFCDSRTNLGDATNDFVTRNARVNCLHEAAPLVARVVQVGVADAAEEDFDLDVVWRRVATRDGGVGQRQGGAGGGICFGLVHVLCSYWFRCGC
jgi:hypothetical protein